MQAEKISSEEGAVFNASDLANGVLAFDKKKKDKKDEPPGRNYRRTQTARQREENARARKPEVLFENSISVYPNPVTNGSVKVSFNDLPAGKYQVQLMDIDGKLIKSKDVVINSATQVENFSFSRCGKRKLFHKGSQ